MKLLHLWRDTRGAAAVEFAMTAPIFFLLLFGAIGAGLLAWAQIGLQHGVEMAARCASVNTSLCGNDDAVRNFASAQTYGLNPPTSTFAVTTSACGYKVDATYPFPVAISYFGSFTLKAESCFPK